MLTNQFKLHGFLIETYSGTIIENHKQTETHVSGRGSYLFGSKVGSYSNSHQEIFLIDKEGKELVCNLYNWDIPIRSGHEINVVSIVETSLLRRKETRSVFMIKNKNLNEIFIENNQLKNILKNKFKLFRIYGIFVLAITFFPFFVYKSRNDAIIWIFLISGALSYLFYEITRTILFFLLKQKGKELI